MRTLLFFSKSTFLLIIRPIHINKNVKMISLVVVAVVAVVAVVVVVFVVIIVLGVPIKARTIATILAPRSKRNIIIHGTKYAYRVRLECLSSKLEASYENHSNAISLIIFLLPLLQNLITSDLEI